MQATAIPTVASLAGPYLQGGPIIRVFFALTLIPALLLISVLGTGQTTQTHIQSMKLLNPKVGWAATDRGLFWTADGGVRWRDITPKGSNPVDIRSVFFLDASVGWVLFVHADQNSFGPSFTVAATSNAGKTWSVKPVKIPRLNPEATTLGGDGNIDFVDSLHGWMNLGVLSSANFRLGLLLVTADGGRSWGWASESPGVSGKIRFTTLKDGWLAGGPGNQELYVTHDACGSWQKVSLVAPGKGSAETYPLFDQPPVFVDSLHGFLPVTFVAGEGTGGQLTLFATEDGGKTWNSRRNLPIRGDTSAAVPSTVADSTLIAVSPSNRQLMFGSLGAGRDVARADALVAPDSAVFELSFVSKARGWALTSEGLLSPTDGGISWLTITPSAVRNSAVTHVSEAHGSDGQAGIPIAAPPR